MKNSYKVIAVLLILSMALSVGGGVKSHEARAAKKCTISRTLTIGENGKAKLNLKSFLKKRKDYFWEFHEYVVEIGRDETWAEVSINTYSLSVKQQKYKKGDANAYYKDHIDLKIKTIKGNIVNVHVNLKLNDKQRAFISNHFLDHEVKMDETAQKSLLPVMTDSTFIFKEGFAKLYMEDGQYVRREKFYAGSGYELSDIEFKTIVEKYDSNYNIVSSEIEDFLAKEDIKALRGQNICGYTTYEGEKYNFVIVGFPNDNDDDSVEVIRIIKYDKNWNRLQSTPIRAIDTSRPFEHGDISIAECGDMLYIHTSHQMYKSSKDGLKHQSNFRIAYNMATGEVTDTHNIGNGYVSHSFQQFIQIKDRDIYTLDKGDAYPRGIYLARYSNRAGEKWGDPTSTRTLVKFGGKLGDNNTGCYVFGFEVDDENCLVFHRQVEMGSTPIGIKMTIIDRKSVGKGEVKTIILEDKDYKTLPNVYKLDDEKYVIMWPCDAESSGVPSTDMYYLVVDRNGNLLVPKTRIDSPFARFKPVIKDGKMIWYRTGASLPYDNGLYLQEAQINEMTDQSKYMSGNVYFFYDCKDTAPIFCELDPMTGAFSEKMTPVPNRLLTPEMYDYNEKKGYIDVFTTKDVTVHIQYAGKEYTAKADKPFVFKRLTHDDFYSARVYVGKEAVKDLMKHYDDLTNFLIWGTKDGYYPSTKVMMESNNYCLRYGHDQW